MFGAESRLKYFIKVVCFQVSSDLGCDDAFQNFRQEWEIGYGAVVVGGVGVKTRFFQDGCDGGKL